MSLKEYKILVIDDLEDSEFIFDTLKEELEVTGYNINFTYIHHVEADSFIINKPYDILMFDCFFPASNIQKFGQGTSKVGYTLIKKFRESNFRTKIIFYSSNFDIEAGRAPFDTKEFLTIINELNVFRMVERNPYSLETAIKDAIKELDMIMVCLEDIYWDFSDEEITYQVDGREVNIKELLRQLKVGGEDAEEFRKVVTESIIKFLLKFKY